MLVSYADINSDIYM